MALVTKIEKIHKQRAYVHKPVDCTYCTVIDDKGEKYLLLDTYGSDDRQIKDKVSQTIEFNKESALQLLDIIQKEFNIT